MKRIAARPAVVAALSALCAVGLLSGCADGPVPWMANGRTAVNAPSTTAAPTATVAAVVGNGMPSAPSLATPASTAPSSVVSVPLGNGWITYRGQFHGTVSLSAIGCSVDQGELTLMGPEPDPQSQEPPRMTIGVDGMHGMYQVLFTPPGLDPQFIYGVGQAGEQGPPGLTVSHRGADWLISLDRVRVYPPGRARSDQARALVLTGKLSCTSPS